MNNRYTKSVVVLTAVVAIIAVGIQSVRNDFGLGRNMEVIANMMRALYTSYVDEINPDDMLRSGATGITATLDPYTVFLAESEMDDFETLTTGKYGGIGALIRQKEDYVIIAEPYKGSPADRAGLKIGDKIVAIDGKDAKGFTTADVSKRLKG